MININIKNSSVVTIDGTPYSRIYQPIKMGLNNLGIYNIFDTSQQILSSTRYSEILLDGEAYTDVDTLIKDLVPALNSYKSSKSIVKCSVFQGVLQLASDPIEEGVYYPTQEGIYPNQNNLEYSPTGYDKGYSVQFILKDGVWTKNRVKISGDAGVSQEIEDLKKSLQQVVNLKKSLEFAPKSGFVDQGGKVVESKDAINSGFMKVDPLEEYTITGYEQYGKETDITFFDSEGAKISSVAITDPDSFTFETPKETDTVVVMLYDEDGSGVGESPETGSFSKGFNTYKGDSLPSIKADKIEGHQVNILPGDNITITEDNTISAENTTYTGKEGDITIADEEISLHPTIKAEVDKIKNLQGKLSPGKNITIDEDNRISSDGGANVLEAIDVDQVMHIDKAIYIPMFDNTNMVYAEGSLDLGKSIVGSEMGRYSLRTGYQTESQGKYSLSTGTNTKANGDSSFAAGNASEALGYASVALGDDVKATGMSSIALGKGAEAMGKYSFATGQYSKAHEETSIAIGQGAISKAEGAIAFGYDAQALGEYSFAVGANSRAQGLFSAAIGSGCESSGFASTALGYFTKTSEYGGLTIGRYSTEGTPQESWVDGSAVFTVGNGERSSSRRNSYTIYNDGKVEQDKSLTILERGEGVILTSEKGKQFKVTVNEDGTLVTKAV